MDQTKNFKTTACSSCDYYQQRANAAQEREKKSMFKKQPRPYCFSHQEAEAQDRAQAAKHIKKEKIMHYFDKEPSLFIQVDGFLFQDRTDREKVDVFCGETWELMGGSDARVLIRVNSTKGDALETLREIYRTIANGYWDDFFEQDENEKLRHIHGADCIPF